MSAMHGGFLANFMRSTGRYAWEVARSAYYSAARLGRNSSGLKGLSTARDPNVASVSDGWRVRDAQRVLNRNNPIYIGLIRSLSANILRTPILVEPNMTRAREDTPSDRTNKAWNDRIETRYKAWCEGPCDFSGWDSHADSAGEQERKMLVGKIQNGMMFAVRRYRKTRRDLPAYQIELIEADALAPILDGGISATARVPGIVYDAQGRPTAYRFLKPGSSTMEYETVAARDVFHIIEADRPGQIAGDLRLNSILQPINWTGQAVASELNAMHLGSRIFGAQIGNTGFDSKDATTPGDPYRVANLDDMTLLQFSGEDDFRQIDFNRPGTQFVPMFNLCVRLISVATGLPAAVVGGDFLGYNYTVLRGAWQQAEPILERELNDIIAFAKWRYEGFVEACVVERLEIIPFGLSLRDAQAAVYTPPVRPYVDPIKDAQADLLEVQSGQNSPQRVCGARGRNAYRVAAEIFEYAAEWDRLNEARVEKKLTPLPYPAFLSAPAGSTVVNAMKTTDVPDVPPNEQDEGANANVA